MMKKTGIFKSSSRLSVVMGLPVRKSPGRVRCPFGYIGLPAMMSKIYVKEDHLWERI